MARNPFSPYPTTKGPAKLLLYGDPGTQKTRRALTMPGPRYMVDLEKGADEYGDLAEPGDQYMACQSHAALVEALDYLDTLPAGRVGTLIVDPITVVWQALQAAHIERVSKQKKTPPEQVLIDQGAWARLNRVHNDVMTRLLNAPYHVVMIARGKELRDNNGTPTGYAYEGHKSVEFLAKTVVITRRDGDRVVKDRTGTWTEGQRGRLDLRDLLARSGSGGARLETPSEAAERDADTPPPSPQRPTSGGDEAAPASGGGQRWTADQARAFFGSLARLVPPIPREEYESRLAVWCEQTRGKRPSVMTAGERSALIVDLTTGEARVAYGEWAARQDAAQGAA